MNISMWIVNLLIGCYAGLLFREEHYFPIREKLRVAAEIYLTSQKENS